MKIGTNLFSGENSIDIIHRIEVLAVQGIITFKNLPRNN